MTIEEFINKAKKQDSRNSFKPFYGNVSNIPSCMKEFYTNANPIDVEINTRKYGNIHFFPFQEIEGLKKEYSYMPKNTFIFASTNGDPIFIQNSQFYITYESQFKPEHLSSSFEDFLDTIRIK